MSITLLCVFILHFYKKLVSKTAAMLKIVYSCSIYWECNVPVLPNGSQILNFFLNSTLQWPFLFIYILFHSDTLIVFGMKRKTKI